MRRAASPNSPSSRPTTRGCCRSSPAPAQRPSANIVDAQIYTTTDGLALDTISLTREFEREDDEDRRASRITDTIEKALKGEIKLPDAVARRAAPKARLKAFALEPDVNINNEWSNRYTVIEVMAQAELRAELKDWPAEDLDRCYSAPLSGLSLG